MSGIDSIAEKLKQKTQGKKVEKSTLQKVNTSKPQLARQTVYLSKEYLDKLDQVYAKRLLSGDKRKKYEIIEEALDLLFQKEII